MGNRPKATTKQARIPSFAKDELDQYVDKSRRETKTKASPVDVLGALILAVRALPPGVVRELVDIYKEEAKRHGAAG